MIDRTVFNQQSIPAVTRELDRRTNDGIEVALLWNPRTNQVLISVVDERRGGAFQFEVGAPDALRAFQHPYAFAPSGRDDAALAA